MSPSFVDAGYLFAQGSTLIAGRKLPRSFVTLDHDATIKALTDFAVGISGAELLRIYWYDGTSTGPTSQHLTVAHLPNVKLRLGFVNSVGEQKGVDSLIVTDMIALARNQAVSDAVLLSGDEDLRVGVQQAQEFGVRVHLLGIKPSRGSQSLFLLQESDTTHEWGPDQVAAFLQCRTALPRTVALSDPTPASATSMPPTVTGVSPSSPEGAVPPRPAPPDAVAIAANQVVDRIDKAELEALIEVFDATKQIPREVDRQLLGNCRGILGRDLDSQEKKQLRMLFVDGCRRRMSE